jgi:ferric-dicitrate binding protein FerR (iron transport regulator)
MNENTTYYTELIARYFSGEIAEDELSQLSDWLIADAGHKELFRQYQKTWMLVEKQKVHSAIDPEQEWVKMQSKMNANTSRKETPKVIQLNSDNKNRQSIFLTGWKVAAAVVVLMVSSFLLYNYFSKPSEIVVTANVENIEQLLPDGSVVSLHAGSQITYPEKFSLGTRTIELKGEAYFKVSYDKTKPFIMASGDARVEVLGTEFNVNTNSPAGNMEVVLTTGKVSVYYSEKPKENVLLLPGEKAELLTGQKFIRKETNTDPNYMAWKTRVLVFENETLGQVVQTLQQVYQSPITLSDQQLTGCRVTASFNDQSLESVLQVLTETLDLQVKMYGKHINISGNGCK